MTTYVVTTIDQTGKATKRTEKNAPDNWSTELIALCLASKHRDVPFQTLCDLVNEQGCAFGYQVAFADETGTYVVTELSEFVLRSMKEGRA